MSIFDRPQRSFRIEGASDDRGVMKIQVGKMTMSITTIDGQNEVLVTTGNGHTHLAHKQHIQCFSDIIHIFWDVEKIAKLNDNDE